MAEQKQDDFELNANQITDRIWLGSEDAAHSPLNILCDKHNIKFILVAGFGISLLHEKNEKSPIIYEKLKCIDVPIYDLMKDIPKAIKFIESSLNKQDGGNLLIHCAQGKSRSSSICIAYLMWKQNISFVDARHFVKSRRKGISLNCGFENQLRHFETTKSQNKKIKNLEGQNSKQAIKDKFCCSQQST